MAFPPSSTIDGQRITLNLFPTKQVIQCVAFETLPNSSYNKACRETFKKYHFENGYILRLKIYLGLSIALGLVTGYLGALRESRIYHVRGYKLLEGREAVKDLYKISTRECKARGYGLEVSPYFHLSLERLSRHLLVWGGTGSGKTVFIIPLIIAAIKRGDKMVIHDVKGDMTAKLKGAVIISPCDARSPVWDIALDITNEASASEFVKMFYPDAQGENAVFTQAAQLITIGYIVYLQTTKGYNWGWADLAQITIMTMEEMYPILDIHYPQAAKFLRSSNVTSEGFSYNISAFLNLFNDLDKAWGNPEPDRERISLKKWVLEEKENPKQQILIFQRNSEYSKLSSSWMRAALNVMAAVAVSPSKANNPERATWFIIDEFNYFGKQERMAELLDLGREKKIHVLIGVQSVMQLKDKYGDAVAQNWLNNIGTHIICRLGQGDAPEFASKFVGRREIQKREFSFSQREGIAGSTSETFRSELSSVMLPSEFKTKLDVSKTGVKLVVLGVGENVYITEFGFRSLKEIQERTIPAEWMIPIADRKKPPTVNKGPTFGDDIPADDNVDPSYAFASTLINDEAGDNGLKNLEEIPDKEGNSTIDGEFKEEKPQKKTTSNKQITKESVGQKSNTRKKKTLFRKKSKKKLSPKSDEGLNL